MGIWIMSSSGQNQRQVVESRGSPYYGPTFSPSGRRIAYVRDDQTLWVVDVDGSHRRRIAHVLGEMRFGTNPSWSPNGRWIAFMLGGNIYRIHPNGRGRERLTAVSRDAYASDPEFSPNGKRISFTRSLGGRSDVLVMDADGSNPRRLRRGLGGCGTAFSPTGKRMVASSEWGDGGIHDLVSFRSNGTGGIFRITRLGFFDDFHNEWIMPCYPSWQPRF
jgi:TolB protein